MSKYVVLLQQGNVVGQEVLEIAEGDPVALTQAAAKIRDARNQAQTGFALAWNVEVLPVPEPVDGASTD